MVEAIGSNSRSFFSNCAGSTVYQNYINLFDTSQSTNVSGNNSQWQDPNIITLKQLTSSSHI